MILRFLIVSVVLAIVVGALVGLNYMRDQGTAAFFASMQMPPVTVSAVSATAETWPDYLEAIGSIAAVEGIELAPEVAGVVSSIGFKPNEAVEAGRVLVQLDDSVERSDVRLWQSEIDLSTRTLERVRTLRERGNAPQADVDVATTALAKAQAQLNRVEAVIDQKAVEAPFPGVVGIRKVDVGQYVSAGDPLVTLQRIDQVYVDFTLPEQALPRIAMGQAVEVRADAFPGEVFTGAVSGIEPVLDPNNRTVIVRATLPNPDLKLRPGIFANVRLLLPDRPNVVTVPQTAITFSLYGNTVFVVREGPAFGGAQAAAPAEGEAPPPVAEGQAGGGEAGGPPPLHVEQVFVQVGQRRGTVAEIAQGVQPGDLVVTSGQLKLQNQFPVVIDNRVDIADAASGPAT